MYHNNGNYSFWGMHMGWWFFMFVVVIAIIIWYGRSRKNQ
jgi:lipoprotein signal peptidase